jgi:hypothetical protein
MIGSGIFKIGERIEKNFIRRFKRRENMIRIIRKRERIKIATSIFRGIIMIIGCEKRERFIINDNLIIRSVIEMNITIKIASDKNAKNIVEDVFIKINSIINMVKNIRLRIIIMTGMNINKKNFFVCFNFTK